MTAETSARKQQHTEEHALEEGAKTLLVYTAM